ncbi:unnamed protein product [Fusarium graminearum]|uniref:Chromosome 1, complete genome n=1 Tax=Gibberella zeae (strain ATCC MYA-4620 / CBS 123657 / FGSC 9075 / NRRL 31084 / PH-1) TaxID=229533 RepID=I1S4R2_GIBZE|nr:hypothetical protein FGSG_11830 [Fusarium graminearum PH-1]ESU06051.1 hypothetical protein FGSG_11830 [Fusarium graminearum PH-1]EYB26515.1 hypothetical protein FG05_11830 [Fusarium graminearum]CEF72828.1 unnamed protein product [Fusarium graminearum]CZS76095.1 unnamed protein product [Fusarium graminearum]|eukprot:XP_011316536.1 hypothetical protein FGSG_11830 [Fusarium graminearum PH-1]
MVQPCTGVVSPFSWSVFFCFGGSLFFCHPPETPPTPEGGTPWGNFIAILMRSILTQSGRHMQREKEGTPLALAWPCKPCIALPLILVEVLPKKRLDTKASQPNPSNLLALPHSSGYLDLFQPSFEASQIYLSQQRTTQNNRQNKSHTLVIIEPRLFDPHFIRPSDRRHPATLLYLLLYSVPVPCALCLN